MECRLTAFWRNYLYSQQKRAFGWKTAKADGMRHISAKYGPEQAVNFARHLPYPTCGG